MATANSKQVLKDKKIVIYKKVTYKDAGFQTTGYMPIHEQASIWAYFKQLSASLLYASSTTTTKEECLFRINWLDYLRTAYPSDLTIGYRGILYQITRIDPFEDYTRDMVLYGSRANVKTISPIIPYDPSKL